MHPEVVAAFRAFTEPLEGYVTSMYVDVKGLVTTGCGNLIDPVSAALLLPWKHADGSLATQNEISAAWHTLKAQAGFYSKRHWNQAAKLNDLRLSDADIDVLVLQRLESNVALLRRTFTKWDDFPADGQLGILSMAWAVGAGFPRIFGNFTAAVLAGNWDGAVASCAIREEGNPGIVPRNAQNRLCFANAAMVARAGFDIDRLNWPNVVPPSSSAMAPELKTAADVMLEAKRHNDAVLKKFIDEEYERVRAGMSTGAAIREFEES